MMRLVNRTGAVCCAAAVLLGWCSASHAQVELVTNGGFETGDLTGWTVTKNVADGGGWALNNGSTAPPSGELASATAPISGNFDAVSGQTEGGIRSLTSDLITIPTGVTGAVLSWSDRIRNWDYMIGGNFDSIQELRVEILDAGNGVLAEVYYTAPGDPAIQMGPNGRSFDLTGFLQGLEGQQIRLRFEQQDERFFFNVNIDNVSLLVQTTPPDPVPPPDPDPVPDPDPIPDPAPEPDPALPFEIILDVKPGSDDNPINLKENGKSKGKSQSAGGVLPVAVLTTADFDAANVDVTRIGLGDPLLQGIVVPIRAGLEDVDLDGDLDLILHFSILEMVKAGAINDQTTSLCLGGYTLDNLEILGSDEVRIVPAGNSHQGQTPKREGNSNSHGGKSNKGGKKKH